MNAQIGQEILTDPDAFEIEQALLLRERMIVELYQRVIDRFQKTHPVSSLRDLKLEHQKSVAGLSILLKKRGCVPQRTAGGLSEIRRNLSSSKCLTGKDSAVSSLLKAEQLLRRTYRRLLTSRETDQKLFDLIEFSLLPRTVENLAALQSMVQSLESPAERILPFSISA